MNFLSYLFICIFTFHYSLFSCLSCINLHIIIATARVVPLLIRAVARSLPSISQTGSHSLSRRSSILLIVNLLYGYLRKIAVPVFKQGSPEKGRKKEEELSALPPCKTVLVVGHFIFPSHFTLTIMRSSRCIRNRHPYIRRMMHAVDLSVSHIRVSSATLISPTSIEARKGLAHML